MTSTSTSNSTSNSILSSPFFRTEIVLGLAHDSLTSTSFPRKELEQIFTLDSSSALPSYAASTSTSGASSSSISTLPVPDDPQRQALEQAIKALSSQLALPENQLKLSYPSTTDASEKDVDLIRSTISSSTKLTLNHVRLQLGGCLLLIGELARSGAQLELVSNDLRPSRKRTNLNMKSFSDSEKKESNRTEGISIESKDQEGGETKVNEEESSRKSRADLTSRAELALRIKALLALSKVHRLQGKESEALKYEKWANEARESIERQMEGNR